MGICVSASLGILVRMDVRRFFKNLIFKINIINLVVDLPVKRIRVFATWYLTNVFLCARIGSRSMI
jgi:hypothetical protein